jgi:phosphoribosylaminoimidazolecarboxamide formyltransferase/IMP cyclohydrolase
MVNIVQQVDDWVTIRRVLVSVSDKSGLDVLIPGLLDVNPAMEFYATGGTFEAITQLLGPEAMAEDSAAYVIPVSDYTGQPETQGGLVKTLDFKLYLGLLTETYNQAHQADLARTGAVPLDLVVANLYPFEATVAREGVTVEEARAHVDIGGPCMIRAAAKNYLRVAVVVDPADYPALLEDLVAGESPAHDGALNLAQRFELAQKAFAHTAVYDRAIRDFLAAQNPAAVPSDYDLKK